MEAEELFYVLVNDLFFSSAWSRVGTKVKQHFHAEIRKILHLHKLFFFFWLNQGKYSTNYEFFSFKILSVFPNCCKVWSKLLIKTINFDKICSLSYKQKQITKSVSFSLWSIVIFSELYYSSDASLVALHGLTWMFRFSN